MSQSGDRWRQLISETELPCDFIYEPINSEIFQYEPKRAGSLLEQLYWSRHPKRCNVQTSTNNSNTLGGIKDVQVHKSKFGKETRVETELQSCGPATDININIIMDSDSNVSNVASKSIEYESQDLMASEETPTPDTSGAGGSAGKADDEDGDGGKYSVNSDEDGGDGDDVDGEGEEEEGEGDADDALKHYLRYLNGEKVENLRGPCKEEEAKETLKKLPTGHLEKEGVVIGCMSVFADVHVKEFIVLLSDDMIQAFLIDPERFRAVASRTKCEIEVTRRVLNRRMGKYRWLKYLVVIIRGPSFSSIDQCDKMMTMLFPPYKWRKAYGSPAAVSMFLKESTPDNTDLYFNYQRTGPCQKMFGELPLRAPFRKTKGRPVEQTPWKMTLKRQQWGILEPRNNRIESVMSHVYPERGTTRVASMDHNVKWSEAATHAVDMSKAKDLARSQMLTMRKIDSEPLYARVAAE